MVQTALGQPPLVSIEDRSRETSLNHLKESLIDPRGPLNAYAKQIERATRGADAQLVNLDKKTLELLATQVSKFIETVVDFSCDLAQHRNSNELNEKDVALHLDTAWNYQIPGFVAEPTVFPSDKNAERIHDLTLSVKRKAELEAAKMLERESEVKLKNKRSNSPVDNSSVPSRKKGKY